MNKLEKILELSKEKGYRSLFEECVFMQEHNICDKCSVSKVMGYGRCDMTDIAEELLEPYEEPRKLTTRERAFCEYAQSGWIARDEDNYLYWSFNKPHKYLNGWGVDDNEFEIVIKELFPFIKWEDKEPYSVEELLKWEVEE